MAAINTLYAVLGLEPTATAEEIEAAYARARQLGHGDADAASLQRMAYDTLRVPEQRAAYDRKLARQAVVETTVTPQYETHRAGNRWPTLLVLLLLVLAAGYWWASHRPKAPLPPDLAMRAPSEPRAEEEPGQATADSVQEYIPLPATNASAATTMAAGEGSGTSVDLPMPTRGARKAGFDPEYLAWSSFQIRQRKSAGSGVLIGPDRILTNCHVLAGGAMGIVVIHSLTRKVSKVEKYARLEGEDACLLFAPGAGGEVIEWGNSSELKTGDTVYTFGHPGGATDLIWSEAQFLEHVSFGGNPYLRTANYCRPGSSGGPLLDSSGRLVGIVTTVQVRERGGERSYGACQSLTESSARQLLGKSLFPIGLAPAQYHRNY